MMNFLDIIVDYPRRIPVVPRDTMKVPVEVPDTVPAEVPVPVEVPDTVSAAQDLLATMGGSGDNVSVLLWSAVAVVVALTLCFWLAKAYRHRLHCAG